MDHTVQCNAALAVAKLIAVGGAGDAAEDEELRSFVLKEGFLLNQVCACC